jgi:hypothetical protein
MFKKQQKWIALLVTLTFMWLLQVSTMPLAAADTMEQVSSVNSEQGPGYVEAIKHSVPVAKKKSILPYVLIGVGVVAVTAVLILLVFKTSYDITGTWIGTEITYGTYNYKYVFSGDKKSGTVVITEVSGSGYWSGTYTVDGKNVAWAVGDYAYTGTFDSKTTMKGNITYTGHDYGTFSMTKE